MSGHHFRNSNRITPFTGKTTLLKSMIVADMEAGRGLAMIDPHGDLFNELLTRIPPRRTDDVIVLDPINMEYPVGLNILEYRDPDYRYSVVREMRAIMEHLLEDQYNVSVRVPGKGGSRQIAL